MENTEEELQRQEAREREKEVRDRERQWDESLSKFFLDMAKVVASVLVIGNIVSLDFISPVKWKPIYITSIGIVATILLIATAKRIVK
ncbi:hypothetical protein Barb4_01591 [Bacteroidales bacterium Barb4]|nr:hypothetical protein Barb4_01591 [Bacteroidales bacterium Barb4]